MPRSPHRFSNKYTCGSKILMLLCAVLIGIVARLIKLIKFATGGLLDLRAFWFPMPFHEFWKAGEAGGKLKEAGGGKLKFLLQQTSLVV